MLPLYSIGIIASLITIAVLGFARGCGASLE